MVCPEGNIDYLQVVALWSMYCQCAPHIKASLFPYDCITRYLQSCAPMDCIHVFDFALPWFCEHTDREILILMLIEMVYFNKRLGRRGFALKQGYLCVIIVDELGQAVNL